MGPNRLRVVACFSAFLAAAGAWAETGYTSANFLKIGMGARAAAMADAFTAVADDATAVYWNPAGLALTQGIGLSATHGEWLQGIQNDFFAVSADLGRDGALGFSLMSSRTGDYLSALEAPGGGYGGTGGAVGADDREFSAAYALGLGSLLGRALEGTYAGIRLDYLSQSADGPLGDGLSLDLGVIQKIGALSLGLVVQNLGTSIQERPQPLSVKLGAAYVWTGVLRPGDNALLDADLEDQSDSYLKPSVGMEYRLPVDGTWVSLRCGGRTTDDLQGFSFLTAGAGLSRAFDGWTASLDYALAPYGVLGLTNRFTLNLQFLDTTPAPKDGASPQDGA